jgi:hypothetical protein
MSHAAPAPHIPHTGWFKSSFTDNANACVEVCYAGDRVLIRDSKYLRDPANAPERQPIITITSAQWAGFLGELTGTAIPGSNGALLVDVHPDGAATLRTADGRTALHYTPGEWRAYLAGVHAQEFALPA